MANTVTKYIITQWTKSMSSIKSKSVKRLKKNVCYDVGNRNVEFINITVSSI